MSKIENPNEQSRRIDRRFFSTKDISLAAAGAIQQEFFNEAGAFQAGVRNGNIGSQNKISGGRMLVKWVKMIMHPMGLVATALDTDISQIMEVLSESQFILKTDRDEVMDICPIEFFSGQSIQLPYQSTAASVTGLEIPMSGVKIPLEVETLLTKDSTMNGSLYANNPIALAGRSIGLTFIVGGEFRFGDGPGK